MHPLLDDLAARRTPAGRRWRDWAATLAARRARVAVGSRAAGVLLALPGFRRGAVAHHRSTTVLRWSPRISVVAVLQAAAPPGSLSPSPARISTGVLRTVVSRIASVLPAHVLGQRTSLRGPRSEGRPAGVDAPPLEVLAASSGRRRSRRGELTVARSLTPAPEILRPASQGRRSRRGELTVAPALGASRTVHRQLVHERHRIEVSRRAAQCAPAPPPGGSPVVLGGSPFPVEHGRGAGPRSREPMALRRPPAPPVPAAVAARTWGADSPAESRPAAGPVALTGADLGRLTDQVVEQIDRRIVAHRERQGRI